MENSNPFKPIRDSDSGGRLVAPLLLFLTFVVIFVVLNLARSILIPFALAMLLAYLLYPVVNFLNQLRIPYGVCVILVVFCVLAIFLALVGIVVGEINSLANSLPQYLDALKEYTDKAYAVYNRFSERLAATLPGRPGLETDSGTVTSIVGGVVSNLLSGLRSVLSLASDFVIILFMLIFLLADARVLKEKIIKAWGKSEEQRAREIVEKINRGISAFIIIRTIIAIGMAVVVTALLLILGIDYAYVWGPLAGICNFIPYVGGIVSFIPPLLVALATSQSYWTPVIFVVAYVIIQNVEGNYVTPRVVGERVNLNALAVLLSLILWSFIWGPVGMLLSTPITACFKILCDHIDPLKPIGLLLGGRRGASEQVPPV